MCGIVGYIGRQGNRRTVGRMADFVYHRGPDSLGLFVADRVALGIRRLAIIDRTGGDQPIHNETGQITVVFNGEIYNHHELRRQLQAKQHRFATDHADTEVLVHGYEEWGIEGLLARLNGMFAFALWDAGANRLMIARDRMGVKPLYYTRRDGVLYFSSEVKAFRAIPEIPFALNEGALPDYLCLRYVPAPSTLFADIHKLPAGHYMIAGTDGNMNIRRYWIPRVSTERMSDDDYVERFGEILRDSVRIRMESEVPLGAYLSEGLDSNLLVWAMAQEVGKVSTYSMGFGGRHDETAGARRSAEIMGTDHNEMTFNVGDFSDLASAIWHLDEPIGDAHILPTYLLAREAKKTLTVILIGEGADESLYGYPFYKLSHLARRLIGPLPGAISKQAIPAIIRAIPLPLLNALSPIPGNFGEDSRRQLAEFAAMAADGHGRDLFHQLAGLYGADGLNRLLLRPPIAAVGDLSPGIFDVGDDGSPDNLLRQIHDAQFSGGWLQDNILLRHDKMAMAHSVECREPYLDYRLVEFMAGVPRRLKVSGWKDKILARRFAERHIHPEIARRPKKPFFVPMENFLASGSFARLVAENLDPQRIKRRGLFRHEAVAELIARADSRDFLAAKRVMSLVMLELWQRTMIDGELAPMVAERTSADIKRAVSNDTLAPK